MQDISIEYAHIYTHQKVNEEHELSLKVLGELRQKLKKHNQTSSLVVMVDDYSFPDPSFDYEEFSKWLMEQGHKPDLVIRESQLIPLCDEVIKLIREDKLKDELTNYVKGKKYPCSLFIAAWYLLRLGKLHYTDFNEKLSAEQLINILPISFKPFEDKALEIIKCTKFAALSRSIEYKFLEGRDLV